MKIKKTFPVVGMSCASCAARIDKVIHEQPGVYEANINYATAQAQVVYDTEICSVQALKNAVQDAGYDLLTETDQQGEEKAKQIQNEKYRLLKIQTFGAILLSLPIMVISMVFVNIPYMNYVLWFLSTCVVLGFGNRFYLSAWQQLKHGTSNMDTLVANSTGIAYLFSVFNLLFPDFWLSRGITPHLYFEAASGIIAFILLGRLLEERAKQNTSTAIRRLAGLQPKTITIVTGSGEQTVPIENARIGDTIAVKPGERIAVDGTVISGDSYVDESMLSGEPIAVHKQAGEKVYAGTVNQKGAFHFTADKTGADTMLAQIIRMVQDAQGSKAPVQKLVDKIAGIFVPVIIGIALLTFGLWCLFAPTAGFSHGLLAMITVLIIACPCALGLATPTALIVGIGKGAEHGILIKDAESLEIAKKIDTVVLDKTGTVTEGKPVVSKLIWNTQAMTPGTGATAGNALSDIFYSLEKLSEHPLAEAVVNHLKESASIDIQDFESITGKGVKGRAQGRTYLAGNRKLLEENHIAIPPSLQEEATRLTSEAQTVIWFADEENVLAIAGITDRIKETSIRAVSELHAAGIEVHMLTGDNEATAREIARKAGIAHYQASVLPQDKAAFVSRLQAEGRKVAMVGDGINDSAALAQADLSIAMGGGSDIAMDVAKMTIISSDLTKIPEALCLSRLTVRTIRQNLFWAFIYNIIGVPIAAGILYPINGFLLNPMIAGAAMAFSSVSVVSNSLLLKRKRIHEGEENKEVEPPTETIMKKEFKVEGMMCNHCRMHVEKALNSMEGIHATVTLNPPVATVEFSDGEKTLEELQKVVTKEAGDYTLKA